MTALRKPAATRYCPACARIVPLTHMQVHIGYGVKEDMKQCKDCGCSSRIANSRAQMAVHQGGLG